MRIQEVRERSIPLSRYAGVAAATGGLNTSLVAVLTDTVRDGRRVVGYGHASVGRYAQGGLIRERFAPRLLGAPADSLASDDGSGIDPLRAWDLMMRDEKPGGHGERCVAVGALDMALWDAAAKAAGLPLHRFLARRLGLAEDYPQRVPVYAGGGYPIRTTTWDAWKRNCGASSISATPTPRSRSARPGWTRTGAVSTGRCGFSATLRGWRSTR